MIKRQTRFSMGRWLLIGLFAALALSGLWGMAVVAAPVKETDAPPASAPRRAVVGGAGAGLRATPGGPVIETLPLGAALWVSGRTADARWLQVALDDGRDGWVRADELVAFGLALVPVLDVQVLAGTDAAEDAESATGAENASSLTARVNTGQRNLNLRRGPGVRYGVVGVARNGEELTVVGRNECGDWLLLDLPGGDDVAWAAARYLDFSGHVAQLPVSERLSQTRVVSSAEGYRPTSGLSGKLVFQTRSGGPIMVYDLATGSSRRLTTGMDPAISPDGKTVAFIRDGGGDSGLYLIGIDGQNERRIFIEGKLRTPAWSPDGGWITFSRVVGQTTCRDVGHGVCLPDAPWLGQFPLRVFDVRGLSRVDANGGSFVDWPAQKQAFAPDWGEDGIVYQSQAGLQIISGGPDAATRPLLSDPGYSDPAWRPDGGAIVFVSLEKDHREIFRVNADGSGLVALTRPGDFIENPRPVQHVAPAWSPDGRHLVYLSDQNGDWALYVMNADGGEPRKLPLDVPISYRYQGEQVVSWGR